METDRQTRRRFLKLMAATGAAGPWCVRAAEAEASGVNSQTGYVFDRAYLKHRLSKGHPESPRRLEAIQAHLTQTGLARRLTQLAPEDMDPLPWILRNHSKEHVQAAEERARDAAICRLAVTGALTAVDAVCNGRVANAFCAIRPPGHHAENGGLYGFCFFNNVAIAARYAMARYKVGKILILDWDYHHGNGTQWAFYDDPSVLFVSTHALHAFPGPSGRADKRGAGKGTGTNINIPMPRGAGDEDFLKVYDRTLVPAVDAFKPELILISAGFDSRKGDTLGDFNLSDDGFAKMTAKVRQLADRHAKGRIVSLLEGGYNVQGLAQGVAAHLQALL